MSVNQLGEPVDEGIFTEEDFVDSPRLLSRVVSLLLDHLNLYAISTNATKHGNRETLLRDRASGICYQEEPQNDRMG